MNARHAASQTACAIALLKYFGYKLVMIFTVQELPVAYEFDWWAIILMLLLIGSDSVSLFF